MNDKLQRVLEAANSAPSGENCQPWQFVVSENNIEVHLLPERDRSAYNWGQRSSYLAIGAALENLEIAASVEGLRAETNYFPDTCDENHVADVHLVTDKEVQPDPLANSITTRVTNRKPFSKEPLTAEERDALQETFQTSEEVSLVLVDARKDIERLGRVGSTNEEVMLANHTLHDFFFNHVNWTLEEDAQKKVGFFIKTLELPAPAQRMFKIFRNWAVMRVLALLGFQKVVAIQNAKTNASASVFGGIVLTRTEPIDFVHAGRKIEHLWLTAVSLGLSAQPLTGILFFKLRIAAQEGAVFSDHEKGIIMKAYRTAADIFMAGDKHIAFMLRIGRGESPSAQAIRFPLESVVHTRQS